MLSVKNSKKINAFRILNNNFLYFVSFGFILNSNNCRGNSRIWSKLNSIFTTYVGH